MKASKISNLMKVNIIWSPMRAMTQSCSLRRLFKVTPQSPFWTVDQAMIIWVLIKPRINSCHSRSKTRIWTQGIWARMCFTIKVTCSMGKRIKLNLEMTMGIYIQLMRVPYIVSSRVRYSSRSIVLISSNKSN